VDVTVMSVVHSVVLPDTEVSIALTGAEKELVTNPVLAT
jgi:hypothetical protein